MNIAEILSFDTMMFYQEHLKIGSTDESADYQINENFRRRENGEILYLYDSKEIHLQHVLNFLVYGVEKKSASLIIDFQKNYHILQEKLGEILTESEILKYIHFISKEEIEGPVKNKTMTKLPASQSQYGNFNYYRIWIVEDPNEKSDWLRKMEHYFNTRDIKLNKEMVLFVYSYNATLITAGMHIEMMRNYPYLMTDSEIVDSPFYKMGDKSSVLPSLSIQENI